MDEKTQEFREDMVERVTRVETKLDTIHSDLSQIKAITEEWDRAKLQIMGSLIMGLFSVIAFFAQKFFK